jgi:hypothetical protein
MAEQLDLLFAGDGAPRDGLSAWRAQRMEAVRGIGRRLGLPIGHSVEMEIAGGVVLRGVLELEELVVPDDARELERLRLKIGRCVFGRSEILRCVRMD